ncbi:MAG: hypothetical protein ACR2QB_09475 [Gammaproteobacteria bacterium]
MHLNHPFPRFFRAGPPSSHRPQVSAFLISCALWCALLPTAQSMPVTAGLRDLASIRVLENGDVLLQVPFANAFTDPEVCNGYGPNTPWLLLQAAHPGYLSLYSLVYASATSINFPLQFHVEGCTTNPATGGIGVPIVVSIETQG